MSALSFARASAPEPGPTQVVPVPTTRRTNKEASRRGYDSTWLAFFFMVVSERERENVDLRETVF
jgi:hypothetical protein